MKTSITVAVLIVTLGFGRVSSIQADNVSPFEPWISQISCSAQGSVFIDIVDSDLNGPVQTSVPGFSHCEGIVEVPVYVKNFTDVASFSLSLHYNAGVLNFTGLETVNVLIDTSVLVINASAGNFNVSWNSVVPVSLADSLLFIISFEGTHGNTDLSWDTINPGSCLYKDAGGGTLPSVFEDGNAELLGCSTLEGNVTYLNSANTPLTNVSIYLKQGTAIIYQTLTDSLGHYVIDSISSGTYYNAAACSKPWCGGNSTDALLLLRHFCGLSVLTGLSLAAGNVNQDMGVGAIDCIMICQRFVGALPNFGPNPDWYFQRFTIPINKNTNQVLDFQGTCAGDVNGTYTPE